MLYHLSYVSEARLLLCLLTILRGCPRLLSIYSGLLAATLERETGFEPATPSLEGSCSSQLSYSRAGVWWRGEDSNLRRHKPADLQSAPVGRFGTSPFHIVRVARILSQDQEAFGATRRPSSGSAPAPRTHPLLALRRSPYPYGAPRLESDYVTLLR